jgi:hypothetical protein
VENGQIAFENIAVGGRPLQTTLNGKRETMIHERVIELLTTVQPRVFSTIKPAKIIELFKLGTGTPSQLGIRASEIVDGLYSFLGFTRLTKANAIQQAIAKGIQESVFGYFTGEQPVLGPDGKFQVSQEKVRIGTTIPEDEIDLESGYIIIPQGIPSAVTPPITESPNPPMGGDAPTSEGDKTDLGHGGPKATSAVSFEQKEVDISFTADRNQIFEAWNAIANLAGLAGKVSVRLHAESEKGIDKAKLQNGVIEPLKEANLIE